MSTTTAAVQQKDTTFTKIFVGGLPYHTTDQSLREFFEQFGDIEEAVVITDRQTGKSRGYGFVTMSDRAAAERACKDPNPIIDGRKANVNLAYLGAKPRIQAGESAFPFALKAGIPGYLGAQVAGTTIVPTLRHRVEERFSPYNVDLRKTAAVTAATGESARLPQYVYPSAYVSQAGLSMPVSPQSPLSPTTQEQLLGYAAAGYPVGQLPAGYEAAAAYPYTSMSAAGYVPQAAAYSYAAMTPQTLAGFPAHAYQPQQIQERMQ